MQLINQLHKYIQAHIKDESHGKPFIIGIDGNCGSGKTTLAWQLAKAYDCPVIHMDDFFLPSELRSPKRLEEIGGNFHYERFIEEVLVPLQSGDKLPDSITYQVFDCKSLSYSGRKTAALGSLLIIEGSYSFSHGFSDYYDLKIITKCDYDSQLKRFESRVGSEKLQVFINKWIPLENRYFKQDDFETKGDIVIDTTSLF